MRLTDLLSDALLWRIEDRNARESACIAQVITVDQVASWADKGIKVKRGCYSSETESALMVQIIVGATSCRVDVKYHSNGKVPAAVEIIAYGTKLPETLPSTVEELSAMVKALVVQQGALVSA